jgi:hypothetical protein
VGLEVAGAPELAALGRQWEADLGAGIDREAVEVALPDRTGRRSSDMINT